MDDMEATAAVIGVAPVRALTVSTTQQHKCQLAFHCGQLCSASNTQHTLLPLQLRLTHEQRAEREERATQFRRTDCGVYQGD